MITLWKKLYYFVILSNRVRGEGNVRNLRVEGLKWYLVDRVNFNAFRLTLGVQITVPWIITTGRMLTIIVWLN